MSEEHIPSRRMVIMGITFPASIEMLEGEVVRVYIKRHHQEPELIVEIEVPSYNIFHKEPVDPSAAQLDRLWGNDKP